MLDEVPAFTRTASLFHQGQLWQVALWGFLLFRIFTLSKFRLPDRSITKFTAPEFYLMISSVQHAVLVMYGLRGLAPLQDRAKMVYQFTGMTEKPGFWENPVFFNDREGENKTKAETSHASSQGVLKV